MTPVSHAEDPEIILIGSGIMSASLGALLKRLEPTLRIQVYEAAPELAPESSHGWNNAGTGHAGLCELSYTPERDADGRVRVAKAIDIFAQFEHSLQFWAYAVASGMIDRPADFINPVPHLSFVRGREQVDFLRARHAGLSAHHFFRDMEFTTDRATIADWAPLVMEGRSDEPIAATRVDSGTDVNFGVIARKLLGWLARQEGCGVAAGQRVVDLQRDGPGWAVHARDAATGEIRRSEARFVFIGAGGGSLLLLQKAGLPEAKGLGGFPIGGQWLVCDNPAIVARHRAKVYGQALGAAPTMAVPHLDARMLEGKRTLLFGPFAAWTTRFLHRTGSWTDLPRSVNARNFSTLVKIGWSNRDLIKYLVQQGTQSMGDRLEVLHEFYPAARLEDWKLVDAGIRVQAIKKTDGEAGIVHYGTEVLTSADRSISALLGASPGASVSIDIVRQVIETCLPQLLGSATGRTRLKEMIPECEEDLRTAENAGRFHELHQKARQILQLDRSDFAP